MSSIINTDIYQLTETVNEIQQTHMPDETQNTRTVSINGYFADIHATQLQNATIASSELSNEMWPSRAKYEKNVIIHSIIQNITDINATPAYTDIYLGLELNTIINRYMKADKFTLDKESVFEIGGREFHLPYDILITRKILSSEKEAYAGRYIMDRNNPSCSITNPYLDPPFIQVFNTDKLIMLKCRLYQYTYKKISKKMVTNNPIENKTFEFEFDDQLVDFDVRVTDNDEVIYLTPILEGSGLDNDLEKYCYYTYLDANMIRIRFDAISYVPTVNAKVEVLLKTSVGFKGNFDYNSNIHYTLTSINYGYNLETYIMFITTPEGGRDRRSVDELRRQLPKEALSRGSISNESDLINYFNILSTDDHKFLVGKKVDNQFERSYYAYLILKDSYNNVIPANTLDIEIDRANGFDIVNNRKFILSPGCIIGYNNESNTGFIIKDEEKARKFLEESPNNFVYTTPFMIVVNADPLYTSYYMIIMNYARCLKFTYINDLSPIQFITTAINWRRCYIEDHMKYKMSLLATQNVMDDKPLIILNDNNKITAEHIKVIAVFYNNGIYDDGVTPYRYFYGKLSLSASNIPSIDYKSKNMNANASYAYEFEFETDNSINDDAKIKILNGYVVGSTAQDYGYFSSNTNVKIYFLTDIYPENGRYDLDEIIPEGLEGWSVTNMYTIDDGVDFFINYSNIISSTTLAASFQDDQFQTISSFKIKSVPLIKWTYGDNEEIVQEFIAKLHEKKLYIDNAIRLLHNNFNIDYKLVNTYGPSRTYSLDRAGEDIISRVNLTLNFEIKLIEESDVNTAQYIVKDIKDMIEDLNDISTLHIPNLITEITNKYCPSAIEYIEFLGFNEYGPGKQHLYRNEYDDVFKVPEFLTTDVAENLTPAINIHLA